MMGPGNAATYGIGWTTKQVTVRELIAAKKLAVCVDTEGQHLEVTTAIHRTGITPQVGQTWLVDRTYGAWSFAAWWGTVPPEPDPSTDWQPITLQNGWVPSTGAGDPPPMARVTKGGMVELSGVMQGGTVPGALTVLTVGQLPAGFPLVKRVNAILTTQFPSGTIGLMRGAITAAGGITIIPSAAFTPSWIDLSSLRAKVDA
jgi:hypothetical protein